MNKYLTLTKENKYLILLPLLSVLTRLIIFYFIPHTYEDAFITFRYAENFAAGNGLVYNLGEKVYGTTTPLFALILAFFKLLSIPCVISSLIINIISEGITTLIVFKFLKDFSDEKIAAIISLLFVFSPSNISWSIQGMETAFFGSVIALSFYFVYKEKYSISLLLGFLAAMIRIDGLSVPLILLMVMVYKLKFQVIKHLSLPLLLFIVWLAFLFFYYGNFLPNSMLAKLILYSGHQSSIIPNLKLILSKFFITGFFSSSIMTLLFLLGIVLIIKKKIKLYPIVIWFVIYYSALIISKTSIHGWYLIPPLFTYITISGIGIIFLYNKIIGSSKINPRLFRMIIFSAVIIFSVVTIYLKIIQIKNEFNYEQNLRMKVGLYLNYNTPKKAKIFLEPIGVIGYYSQRYIYDDAALVSPKFLELNKLPNTPVTRFKKIMLVKPDYLVIRNVYLKEFYEKTGLLSQYSVMKRFNYNNDPVFPGMTVFKKSGNL